MSVKQKGFTVEFKPCVVLDALTGERTLSELTSKYGVPATQLSKRKK